MKTLFNHIKKSLFLVVMAFALIVTLNATPVHNYAEAAYRYVSKDSITITNGDFTSYSTGIKGQPYSLSSYNWAVNTDSSVIAGVIDTGESNFEENNKFNLAENPKTDETIDSADDYILMFKLNRDDSSLSGKGSATSDSITLLADKYYDINIRVKTTNDGAASIYASYASGAKFQSISGEWNTYHLLVATDAYKDQSFTLTLRYGADVNTSSKGEVFFDHISIDEISETDFFSADASLRNIVKTDLSATRNLVSVANNFENPDFETGITGYQVNSISGGANAHAGVYPLSTISSMLGSAGFNSTAKIADALTYQNTNALAFIHQDKATSSVESKEDNLLTIKQHGLYRLSILVKTGNISGTGLNVELIPTADENDDFENVSISYSSADTSMDSHNGFARLNFFVKGSLLKDVNVGIKFTMEDASGWAIVDNITLIPLTSSEYSDKSTGDNKLDLSVSDESSDLKNGRFDQVSLTGFETTYPKQPANWSFVGQTNNSGVIRINPAVFASDSANYGYPENPKLDDAFYDTTNDEYYNENVLMLWNNSSDEIYYKSDSYTLSSTATTIKYSVDVKTLGNAKAYVKLVDSDNNTLAVIDNINTSNKWKTQNLYITNGLKEMNVSFVLGMEGHSTSEYVFFDCAVLDTSASTENVDFSTSNNYLANFSNNGFASHSNKVVAENVYEDATFSTLDSSNGAIVYGVVDTRDVANLNTREDATDNNVFVIKNSTSNYITLLSNYTYTLTQDSYYEFSVWVKANNCTLDDGSAYGARFEVATLDEDDNLNDRTDSTTLFSNIVTSTDNNGWTKYSIYLLSEADQNVKILLGLGDENNWVQGSVYFDDITAKSIERSEYADVVANDTTIVTAVVEKEDETEEEATQNKQDNVDFNIFAIFSSILLVLALILAIIGFIIRRHPKKEKPKAHKKAPSYSKSTSGINKTDISRELGAQRRASVADIDARLSKLNSELNSLKADYEASTKDDEFVDQQKYKDFSAKANVLRDEIENLESAKAYLLNEQIAKHSENKEYKKRQRDAEKEYEKLKQQDEE